MKPPQINFFWLSLSTGLKILVWKELFRGFVEIVYFFQIVGYALQKLRVKTISPLIVFKLTECGRIITASSAATSAKAVLIRNNFIFNRALSYWL